MKISDFYKLEPIKEGFNLSRLEHVLKYDYQEKLFEVQKFLKEIENVSNSWDLDEDLISENRISMKYYMDESDNQQKYGANLYAIFFDNKPFMLIENFGRYFGEYNSYLTNLDLLKESLVYILDVATKNKRFDEFEEEKFEVNENEDIPNLGIVANYNFADYYDTSELKYNIGDIVWAWTVENHLKESYSENYKGLVLTRIKINGINKHDKFNRYIGSQLDRYLDVSVSPGVAYIFEENTENPMHARLAEGHILGLVEDNKLPSLAINNFIGEKLEYINSEVIQKKNLSVINEKLKLENKLTNNTEVNKNRAKI